MARLKRTISWLLPQVISKSKGNVAPVLEVTWENGRKVLNGERVNYSFGSLHDVFRIALRKALPKKIKLQDALILGFGTGSIATILTEEMGFTDLQLTGVEADAEVIRLAREEFDVQRFANLQLVNERAEVYVQRSQEQFDLICVDVFVEDTVPEACRSEAFFRDVSRLLRAKGKMVFNLMLAPEMDADAFRGLLETVFAKVEMHKVLPGDTPNLIFIATK